MSNFYGTEIKIFTGFGPVCNTENKGEHITDIYITEFGTTELENLSHNIIDIFIVETEHESHLTLLMLKNIHICHK